MEFFLEMLLTAVVAFFFSFLVAKLVSLATAGNAGIGVCDDFVMEEELCFGMKMDAPVFESEINFRVADTNVETVDRVGSQADRVDELQELARGDGKIPAEGEELVVLTPEPESIVAFSPGNVIAEDEPSDSAESEELMVQTTESQSLENVVTGEIMNKGQEERSESTEETSASLKNEGSGDAVVAQSEEVRVEESNTVEESENNTEEENEERKELSIEEDDDWEGIERSELEKAFAAAANYWEESGKAEEIGAEAKMELYGLHKVATEGSCREAQPMAVMLSARAKWNAWQKLGNMSQEEAMEQYLSLISKEIPDFMNTGPTIGKKPEMETSVVLPPTSGSLEDQTTLDTTGVASSVEPGKA